MALYVKLRSNTKIVMALEIDGRLKEMLSICGSLIKKLLHDIK